VMANIQAQPQITTLGTPQFTQQCSHCGRRTV